MADIGRPLLLPLIEELRVGDPVLKIELINVIGQIRYPQALPALRAIDTDPATSGELKAAVESAIKLIDPTGQAINMSASDLSLKAAENYYDRKASYLPLHPDEKTNPIWVFDAGLKNVQAIQVPTPIWNSAMALRLAEATLKQDANNGNAISLWLAANLRREIQLPAGATDPTRGNGPDASFYVLAAGPKYVNNVLGRALDAHDAALALRAIDGLEATGGATGLVSEGDRSPLVRALSYADRAVRYRAAFALARANPVSQFPSFFRVVPILNEAVNSTGSPTALLISADEDARNKLAESLRNSNTHYTVYAGATVSDALEQARRAPSIDVVIVANGPEVGHVAEIARNDYRLAGAPVLVTAPADNLPNVRLQLGQTPGYAAVSSSADEPAIASALTAARADSGNVTLDAEKATQFAATALDILGNLAADHHSIYNVIESVPTLSDTLKDKRAEIASAAARVLGKISSTDGQHALAISALGSDVDPALRIVFLESLAESAKRAGNSLDASQVNALIKIVSSDPDPKIRLAAARALGALNVPSNQASTLILQQSK
jgi:HEAT repeat protein